MSAQENDVERYRPRLFGIAYRMLGSHADAEDAVQEAYLRWHQSDAADVRSPEAWLVTVVTRLSIDRLRQLSAERERYPGPWLPEPIAGSESWLPDPQRRAELASDLSMAFLMLLERLAPEERAGFLLREVFGHGYAQIAEILGKSQVACRQIVHRAKERVRRDRPRFRVADALRVRLIERLVAAIEAGDEQTLLALFAKDATWTTDGGGKVRGAGLNVIRGGDRIVRLLLGLRRKYAEYLDGSTYRIATLNGEPGLLRLLDGQVVWALSIATDGRHIQAVYNVINPEKLRHLVPKGALQRIPRRSR